MKFEAESLLHRADVLQNLLRVRLLGLEELREQFLEFVSDLESYLEEVTGDDT